MKNKFSADIFKKKLFGGTTTLQTVHEKPHGNYSSRSSTSGFPNDLLNKSIASPYGHINTTTEGNGVEHTS